MAFTVRLAHGDGWLNFANPRQLLCATTPDHIGPTLEAAERALDEGHHIAGFLSYELGAALSGTYREPEVPLAVLGVFDRPDPWTPPGTSARISPLLRTIDAQTYAARIDAIHRVIYDGDVYQVNYTVPFDLAIPDDVSVAFGAIALEARAPFSAMIVHDDVQILSWSPELFLQFEGDRLTTRPMKGTAPPSNEHALHSEKNRGEHIMIVDLLRNDLQRVCDDVLVDALCTIERYPRYSTMTSTISGTIRPSTTFGDIIRATFPCGSITGAPKRAALHHIAALEPRTRGAYCGTIGYLSPERRGWWSVAIRTAQLRNGVGRFDVGGGIVIDSSAEDEWREIATKASFLRAASGNLDLLETFAADAPPEVLALHLARLAGSARRLEITYDETRLRKDIQRLAAPTTLLRLRLHHTGLYTIAVEPLTPRTEPVRVCLGGAVNSNDPWLTIKSSWRPAHEAARCIAEERGCFDSILRNERDELTEGWRTNLFIERDGRLLTPPLKSGLLPGILRAQLIEHGRAIEHVLFEDDLRSADAMYVGNSARGLQRAELIG